MDELLEPTFWEQTYLSAETWFFAHILLWSTLAQFLFIVGAFGAAFLLAPFVRRRLDRLVEHRLVEKGLKRFTRVITPLALPLVWLLLQWTSVIVAAEAGWPSELIEIVVSLITAWVIIRTASQLISDPTWARMIAITAWAIAALNIVGLLCETISVLDRIGMQLGDVRISALLVVKAVISLALLLWLARVGSRLLERRINALPNLTPSVQVLTSKILKVLLVTIALLVALRIVGIDLTAFAVLSGAIGVGIGFGLQKVVSNLVSGVILLLDKSIKPGDVIAIDQTYGWVTSLGARNVSVVTRDGIEHLIPNEDFITLGVENWSYSDSEVRLRLPIGISYDADVRKAIALCIESAGLVERVLDTHPPVCLLTGFGDSSVDFELRFWINDPQNGTANVRSEILLLVWDKFQEHGIGIPYPQRDLHLKTVAEIPIAKPPAKRSSGGAVKQAAG